jgi:hypothetical protein
MSYPTTFDTFTPVKRYGDTVTQAIIVPISAVPIIVNTTYAILDQPGNVTIPGLTRVLGATPAAGQFRPYYNSTQIEFGPTVSQTTYNVSYITRGTAIGDLPIQGMIDAITALETTMGLNPAAGYGSIAEYLQTIVVAIAHQHKTFDFSAQCNNSTTAFTLPYLPTQPDGTVVLYNGVALTINRDFIVSGTIVQLLGGIPKTGETLVVCYVV